jgi:hypothetical protein
MNHEDLPKSLSEAIKAGSRFYFTGAPCKKGHLEPRYTSSAECIVCRKSKSSSRHKEKREEILRSTRIKSREKYNNDEEYRLKILAWQKEYREQYRDRRIESQRKYVENNRDKVRVNSLKYQYKRKAALTAYYTDELTEFAFEEARELCKLREESTGFSWEVDHVVPLISHKVCGLHNWTNFAVIPASENRSKQNRYWPDMP